MPSIRDIALRGLNPLSVRMTLKNGMSAMPNQLATMFMRENYAEIDHGFPMSLTLMAMIVFSYHHNHKVQPTPGVGKVLDKAQSQPLDAHFKEEHNGEDTIHVVEDVLQSWPILEVDVLKSLLTINDNH